MPCVFMGGSAGCLGSGCSTNCEEMYLFFQKYGEGGVAASQMDTVSMLEQSAGDGRKREPSLKNARHLLNAGCVALAVRVRGFPPRAIDKAEMLSGVRYSAYDRGGSGAVRASPGCDARRASPARPSRGYVATRSASGSGSRETRTFLLDMPRTLIPRKMTDMMPQIRRSVENSGKNWTATGILL